LAVLFVVALAGVRSRHSPSVPVLQTTAPVGAPLDLPQGVQLGVIPAIEPGQAAGVKLTVDTATQNEWARFAPVTLAIPDIDWSAPFPVENGALSATLTLPKPQSIRGRTYIVSGVEPRTRRIATLLRVALK